MPPATLPQQQLTGTILGNSYRVIRQIAVGGMGELYEATHLRLAGRYAVKVLLPQFAAHEEVIQRFAREAQITSGLRHPNIVSVFDFNTTPDGRAFLAMELLEGHDLATDLTLHGPMSLTRTLDLVGQIVSALSAAHAHGVVHRDLKPPNLFISPLHGEQREIVKVLDFGISKIREASRTITREHSIIGTPQYMAPEQALGDIAAIDHHADQFSLAVITYQLITGQPPFQADSVEAILYQVVHEPPPPLSRFRADIAVDIDSEAAANLEQVLFRALTKSPQERYPSIGAFGQALLATATRSGRRTGLSSTQPSRSQPRVPAVDPALLPPPGGGPKGNTTFGTAAASRASRKNVTAYTLHRSAAPVAGVVGAAIIAAVIGLVWVKTPRKSALEIARLPTPGGLASASTPGGQAPGPPPAPQAAAPAPPPRAAAPPPAPLPPSPAPSAAALAAVPASAAPATLEPAPVHIVNPPASLRVMVDGVPAQLPMTLPRRPGQYHLRFESPGRQPQSIDVDAMAPSHEVRLQMARRSLRPASSPEQDFGWSPITPAADDQQVLPPAAASPLPQALPPPQAQEPPPPPQDPPQAKDPSLIEDVDDAPAPTARPARSPGAPLSQEPQRNVEKP